MGVSSYCEGSRLPRSKCHDVSFWTYLALAAGVVLLLNVLFVAWLAILSRSPRDSDEVRNR